MPTKLQIVALLAAIGGTFGLTSLRYRRKYAILARVLIETGKEHDIVQAQVGYLVDMLNENDIEFDEFDLIALNNAIPQTED